MAANDRAFLRTPLRRVLFLLGAYVLAAVMSAVFAAAVAIVTLQVGGFDELDPAGTALRIAAAVLAWELVTCLFSTAWHWRGRAGLGTFVRTGQSEKRQKSGRRSRALRWTRDALALAAVVFGILLLRFPNEPSAPWAAAWVLVAIKGLQAAIFSSIAAAGKALDRVFERAERAQPPNPNLVPVEDILSRPDIAGQHPYEPRHASE